MYLFVIDELKSIYQVLLIDEISMLGPKQLNTINAVAMATRNNPGPMGGLQCIFTGDFLQLPPVSKAEILNSKGSSFQVQKTIFSQWAKEPEVCQKKETFCFQTAAWKSVVQKSFLLRQVFRQRDQEFIELLDAVRFGRVTEDILKGFTSCVQRSLDCSDGILPTKIFTHRKDVDELNKTELDHLSGQTMNFEAIDSGEASYLAVLQSHCPAKKTLCLKVGAQVILLKTINSAEGLVNGSRGVITRFTSETNRPVVKFSDGIERPVSKEIFQQSLGGRVVAQRQQYPLDLSWGISVHKSQGITVDKAIVNLQKVFEYGQAYVALSRVRSKGGLSLSGPLHPAHIKAHPDVVSFYTELCSREVDSNSK
jgi:ATP-dependent DNA helicase PIF1